VQDALQVPLARQDWVQSPPAQLKLHSAPLLHDCEQPPPAQLASHTEPDEQDCEQPPSAHSKLQSSPSSHAQLPLVHVPSSQPATNNMLAPASATIARIIQLFIIAPP
jgi:hypothetical protein